MRRTIKNICLNQKKVFVYKCLYNQTVCTFPETVPTFRIANELAVDLIVFTTFLTHGIGNFLGKSFGFAVIKHQTTNFHENS